MIYINQISNICTNEYDEVWWIVRSPDASPQKEKLVQSLAPSRQLFRKYREAFHAGHFDAEFFRNEYVPQFLKELAENSEARETLAYLCKKGGTENIALGCYCENEKLCHRSIIAGVLIGMGAQVEAEQEYLKYYELFQKYLFDKKIQKWINRQS